MEITTLVQCSASYIGVLLETSLDAILELMAYLIHIMRVRQDFGGMAWVNYDMAFQHHADNNHQQQTVVQNQPSLYSICFLGVAMTNRRCGLFLSLMHETQKCVLLCKGECEMGPS